MGLRWTSVCGLCHWSCRRPLATSSPCSLCLTPGWPAWHCQAAGKPTLGREEESHLTVIFFIALPLQMLRCNSSHVHSDLSFWLVWDNCFGMKLIAPSKHPFLSSKQLQSPAQRQIPISGQKFLIVPAQGILNYWSYKTPLMPPVEEEMVWVDRAFA